jgi:hypothetical protein
MTLVEILSPLSARGDRENENSFHPSNRDGNSSKQESVLPEECIRLNGRLNRLSLADLSGARRRRRTSSRRSLENSCCDDRSPMPPSGPSNWWRLAVISSVLCVAFASSVLLFWRPNSDVVDRHENFLKALTTDIFLYQNPPAAERVSFLTNCFCSMTVMNSSYSSSVMF